MSQNQSGLTKFFDIREEAVTPATQFISKKNKHLYDWWRNANGGLIPPRKMFVLPGMVWRAGGFKFQLMNLVLPPLL